MRELPPLNGLRAFEAAARHMSFQRAAEELDVTPPAISHQIKTLEKHLGLTLFIRRNPHPLALTKAGEKLYPVLRNGFDSFARAICQMQCFANATLHSPTNATQLTITSINDFASTWLVPRLPKFQNAHPDIDLHLQTSVTVVDLKTRSVDLAIRYGRGNYPGLVVRKLFSDTYIPVCSPQLLARGMDDAGGIAGDSAIAEGAISPHPLQSPEDLAYHPLLHCEWRNYDGPDQPTWQRWLETAQVTTVDWNRGLTFTGESLVIQAAINGQGVGLCSSIHVADNLARGTLVQPFDIELDGFSFYAVYLKDHPKEGAITTFVDWLEGIP